MPLPGAFDKDPDDVQVPYHRGMFVSSRTGVSRQTCKDDAME
jgi:hypothetical protein